MDLRETYWRDFDLEEDMLGMWYEHEELEEEDERKEKRLKKRVPRKLTSAERVLARPMPKIGKSRQAFGEVEETVFWYDDLPWNDIFKKLLEEKVSAQTEMEKSGKTLR